MNTAKDELNVLLMTHKALAERYLVHGDPEVGLVDIADAETRLRNAARFAHRAGLISDDERAGLLSEVSSDAIRYRAQRVAA